MDYKFLPNISTPNYLNKQFQEQLMNSYLELLNDANSFIPEIIPKHFHNDFSRLTPDKLNGFHSIAYHKTIELLNEEKFNEAHIILESVIYSGIENYTGIILNKEINDIFINTILRQATIGLEHYNIHLEKMTEESDLVARKNLEYGISILSASNPNLYNEIDKLVYSVVFFSSKKGNENNKLYSLTSNAMQSLIMIEGNHDNSWIFLLDKYIHEGAHSLLFALNLTEELFYNSDEERYSSPLRKDPRPLPGIYHATFVVQRLIYAFKGILKSPHISISDVETIKKLLSFYLERVNDGYNTVMKYGKLSPIAKDIIQQGQSIIYSD